GPAASGAERLADWPDEGAAGARVSGEQICVRGLVQGVGFRPHVWRIAHDCRLSGDVRNDSDGVLIRAWGERRALERFLRRVRSEAPPLARIEALRTTPPPRQHPPRS